MSRSLIEAQHLRECRRPAVRAESPPEQEQQQVSEQSIGSSRPGSVTCPSRNRIYGQNVGLRAPGQHLDSYLDGPGEVWRGMHA